MSAYTWIKVERGDVSVSMGAWLSALDWLGLLKALVLSPDLPVSRGPARAAQRRQARRFRFLTSMSWEAYLFVSECDKVASAFRRPMDVGMEAVEKVEFRNGSRIADAANWFAELAA